ncbi:MAG: 4-hydroxy-tetrahydrodipicolinate synthase [Planctomycetes bacterium]|nr:4-hydroxy-tetrahydrodipicolinate synthase [Planctomycetota bacterium]
MVVRGTWTALVTPFRSSDLSVDFEALGRLVEAQIAAGVDVLVPCGTTGESPTLTHAEHDEVVACVVKLAAGRVPVVAGTGSNATAEAVRLTRHAAESGADGALVVCPYYNRPSQRMLVEHFRTVASASPLPVILYNIPGRTGVNLEPESVAELRRMCANVAGIKEASGSLDQVARIRSICDIPVLSGDDGLTLAMAALGAVGVVSVASNVAPIDVVACVRDAVEGQVTSARRIHDRLFPLFRALFREPNPVPAKRALQMMGVCSDAVRPPLLAALPETEKALREAMAPLGLL